MFAGLLLAGIPTETPPLPCVRSGRRCRATFGSTRSEGTDTTFALLTSLPLGRHRLISVFARDRIASEVCGRDSRPRQA
jgi:hypothetical protein